MSRSPNLTPSEAWQRATLGVVSISDSRDYLEGLMRNVERHAMRVGQQQRRRSHRFVSRFLE